MILRNYSRFPSTTRFLTGAVVFLTTLFAVESRAAPPSEEIWLNQLTPLTDKEETWIIRRWLLLGPFGMQQAEPTVSEANRPAWHPDYLTALDGEATATLQVDREVSWKTADGQSTTLRPIAIEAGTNGQVDIAAVFGEMANQAAYLCAEVDAPKAGQYHALLGADDSIKVWVNGRLVLESFAEAGRACTPRDDYCFFDLRPGRNRILMKIETLRGGWAAICEILNPAKASGLLRNKARLQPTVLAVRRDGVSAEQAWEIEALMTATLPAQLFEGLKGRLLCRNTRGEAVGEAEAAIGSQIVWRVPEGFYRVEATFTWPDGQSLSGATAIIAKPDAKKFRQDLLAEVESFGKEPGREVYRGWLTYLRERHDVQSLDREVAPGEDGRRLFQTATWLDQAHRDPNAYASQRGAIEWAYLSQADGTGQPFTLRIPDRYETGQTWPLLVYLHGMGGTHGTQWGDSQPRPLFELYVNGRGRAGGYVGLSGVDVMEALAFVQRYWKIDPDRIHLAGGSMGGFGSFALGVRYPDRWASVVPWCGGGSHLPMANLRQVPVYALHSDDDWTVSISHARGAIRALNAAGGQGCLAWTTGLGHGVGSWKEGEQQMELWREPLRRTDPASVRHISYTANDGAVRGAYWASIEEWGPSGGPATFDLRVGSGNHLAARLENIGSLVINLSDSPIDAGQSCLLVINGEDRHFLTAPLPDRLTLRRVEGRWEVRAWEPEPRQSRQHFPGGPALLYTGQPILVVWGTGGTPQAAEKLRSLADTARKSSRPGWDASAWYQTPHGRLPGKADREVTAADLANNNLILLGTPEENTLVARFLGRWPVRWEKGRLQCADGREWEMSGRVMGLVETNPESPDRLVWWIAAGQADFYDAGKPFFSALRWHFSPPDLLVMDGVNPVIVAARDFDNDWRWRAEPGNQWTLPKELAGSPSVWREALGEAIRRGTDAQFALLEIDPEEETFAVGETRWSDVLSYLDEIKLASFTLTGAEIEAALSRLAERPESGTAVFLPTPVAAGQGRLDSKVRYRIAAPSWLIGAYADRTHTNPLDFEVLPITVRDVMIRHAELFAGSGI